MNLAAGFHRQRFWGNSKDKLLIFASQEEITNSSNFHSQFEHLKERLISSSSASSKFSTLAAADLTLMIQISHPIGGAGINKQKLLLQCAHTFPAHAQFPDLSGAVCRLCPFEQLVEELAHRSLALGISNWPDIQLVCSGDTESSMCRFSRVIRLREEGC